jgi:hypothetical protein
MAQHSARKISEHAAVLQRGSEFGGDIEPKPCRANARVRSSKHLIPRNWG